MLGDDIMDGTRSLLGTLKHAAGSAVKGGLMFGAIALGAGILVAAAGAAFVPGIAALAAETLGASATGVAVMDGIMAFGGNILDIAVGSAVIGGGVVGVSNLIPGKDEGFRLRNLFKRKEKTIEREPYREQDVSQSMGGASNRDRGSDSTPPSFSSGNPYYPPSSPAGGGSSSATPHTTTIIDNSRHTTYQKPEDVQSQPDQPPAGGGSTQFGGTVFPPKDRLMDDPNPYFKPGKGMESMQKGNDRGNEPGLQK